MSVEQTTELPLSRGVNAPPFVPGNQAQPLASGSGGGTAAAKPSGVRGSSGSLVADARPFTPGANGDAGQRFGGISASAAAFVPSGASTPIQSPGMSTQAPAFVPRSSPDAQSGRGVRSGQRAEPRGFDSEPGLAAKNSFGDPRAGGGQSMLPPVSLAGGRGGPMFGRGGRGRGSPQQQPQNHIALGGPIPKGGRSPQSRAFDSGGGRGRGPGRSPGGGPFPHPQLGLSLPAGNLGRVYHNAHALADQLLPRLQSHSYLTLMQMTPEMQAESGLPDMIQQFHSLYPLEAVSTAEEGFSRALGVQSLVLKATSSHDNHSYTLRRIGRRQIHPSPDLAAFANEVIEAWSVLSPHPHLVVPRQAFMAGGGGGPSQARLHIVHDYFPGAVTLEAAHLQPQVTSTGLVQMATMTEDTLWTYLLQFAAALRAVHSVNMACRSALHASKVLLTAAGRLRIGSLGIAEIVGGSNSRQDDVAALQREDLASLGRLLLQLACAANQNVSLEYCAGHFSPELVRILAALLGHHSEPILTWHQLTSALQDRAFEELDCQHIYGDAVTAQLSLETENGRMLRLLAKLSMITERADYDAQWAETGDRYLLKLFRDFVFHQCTEDGAPILEWGHVAECLNKLDAGVPEKLVLMSRDEASMLVVSYADVKRCIEATFGDLRRLGGQRPLPSPGQLAPPLPRA